MDAATGDPYFGIDVEHNQEHHEVCKGAPSYHRYCRYDAADDDLTNKDEALVGVHKVKEGNQVHWKAVPFCSVKNVVPTYVVERLSDVEQTHRRF